jgi:hypothetical protein
MTRSAGPVFPGLFVLVIAAIAVVAAWMTISAVVGHQVWIPASWRTW